MSIVKTLKTKTPLKTIFLSESLLVFAMVAGIAPQEFSYLILLLLAVSFIKLNKLDALKLFIISIPFFTALPPNALSDSMSIWRVLILVLVLKICYSELVSESINNKGLSYFQFVKQSIKKIGRNGGNLRKILKQVQDDKTNKLFFLTILFFIIASISLISAQDIGTGVKKILFLLNIFLLFPVVTSVVKKESDLLEILKAILCSSVMIVSIGYFQFISTFFFTLSQFWYFWADNVIKVFYGQNLSHLLSYSNTWFSYYEALPPTLRMFSVMPDSHSFAMFIVASMPVILSLLFYYHGRKKNFLSFGLSLFFLAIFFSGSRGAWVGSIFALMASVYLFLLSSKKTKNNSKVEKIRLIISEFINLLKSKVRLKLNTEKDSKYYSKLIVFSVLLFFILMPVSNFALNINQEIQLVRSGIQIDDMGKSAMFKRAMSIYDITETSNKGRLQIWQETLISIGERPFLGVGFGNFPLILKESLKTSKMGSSAHNIYFEIASEIGIFGLMVFMFLLVEILQTAYTLFYKLEKKYLKIFAGTFFVYFFWICAYGLFDIIILNDKVLMMVVILIGVLYSIKEKSFGFLKSLEASEKEKI